MKLFLLLILIFALNSIGFGQKVIVRDTVKSEILRQTRHINVVVPAFPSRQSDCKMNVVYVLDGDDAFVNLVAAHLAFVRDMDNEIPAFLVVGIVSENTRMDDFMVGDPNRETGRAQKFLSFMSDELFPYIESRYNVTRHRLGVGHSLGGSLLMHALCDRDSLFNAYMMFSPNLVYSKNRLLEDFKAKAPVKLNKFVYLSIGDTGEPETGYLKGIRRFDSLLLNSPVIKGFEAHIDYLTEVGHMESLPVSLGRSVKEYIRYSYGTPGEDVRMAMLAEDDFAKAFSKYYNDRQEYLGYRYYPGVYNLYNHWIVLAGMNGQPRKILQIADLAIKIHEGDSHRYILYLGKAQAYDDMNDTESALKACEDAMKSLQAEHDQYDKEDYKYAEEEINELISEIKQAGH